MSAPVYIPADDLIRVLGLPLALKLVECLGGTGIYSPGPAKLRTDHALVKAIGMEGALTFASEWRQLDVMLPRCAEALRRLRDRALRADALVMSVRKVTLKYFTTERHVYRLLAAADDGDIDDATASAQAKLF